ncbi:hypothetical protein QJS66_17570 [Kocuria rhizophila]|nr:hypothetical protein QJS66_17570 [Kocuria rhizophila]
MTTTGAFLPARRSRRRHRIPGSRPALPTSGTLPRGRRSRRRPPARDAFRSVLCGTVCPAAPGRSARPAHSRTTTTSGGPLRAPHRALALMLELVDSGLARWSQSARHGAWLPAHGPPAPGARGSVQRGRRRGPPGDR